MASSSYQSASFSSLSSPAAAGIASSDAGVSSMSEGSGQMARGVVTGNTRSRRF